MIFLNIEKDKINELGLLFKKYLEPNNHTDQFIGEIFLQYFHNDKTKYLNLFFHYFKTLDKVIWGIDRFDKSHYTCGELSKLVDKYSYYFIREKDDTEIADIVIGTLNNIEELFHDPQR
jgi:hypothetical protein